MRRQPKKPGPCITNVFATRRKNFSQWHRSFQRKLLSHWLKFLRHVAITLVIQGPGAYQAGSQIHIYLKYTVNLLWPSEAIWRHKCASILYLVMVCWRHHATTWTNIDFSLEMYCDIREKTISRQVPKLLLCKMSLEIILLKLVPHF